MTSMRGRGRGARGSPIGGDSRRGSWRGGPPGSAGYASSRNANSNKSDDKVGKGFQTDTDISASSRNAERELKPWSPEEEHKADPNGSSPAGSAQAVRDALTFGMGNSSVPWDQFETNTRLFGAKTDYNEEIYTTKLDRNAHDYKTRERNADRLASEIMSKTSSNPHIAEERGQSVPGDNKDDEEKYSGVVRGQGAYVPPGARKGLGPGGPGGPGGARKDSPKESPKMTPKSAAKEIPKEALKEVPAASKSNGNTSASPVPPNTIAPIPTPPVLVAAPSSSPSPVPPALASRHSGDAVVIDPAIASLGPAPPAAATSMARSTSSIPPQQVNGGGSGDTGSATTPLSKAPIGAVLDQARQFVESERERAQARKQSMAKNERAHVLADLKSWQAKFKVPLPIPKDILPILSKDEIKQKEIEAKAEKSLHEAQERKKVPVTIKSPAAMSNAALSPEPGKSSIKKIPMKIPEIPPFRKRVPPAVPVPETAAQNIALVTSPTLSNSSVISGAAAKLNPNASAFVFKPNPSAAAFQPASSVTSPASTSAKLPAAASGPSPAGGASPAAAPASTSSGPKNPFYRDGTPKRIAVDPRADFSPFKHGQVPPASTIPLQWPYTGRRSSVAFTNMPMHSISAMQPPFEGGEDPSSPHSGPPPMLQSVTPNLVPFYRYQAGMPPMQAGMMPPMFSPGPGFMPPPMGSPHLGGQPPQQGPNGMPMYFGNGMPPNAHFVPPHMLHFHPSGPGRPGPGGPMFYPQQMQGHQAPQMQPQMSFSGQPTPPQPHFQQALPPQGPGGPPQAYEAQGQ